MTDAMLGAIFANLGSDEQAEFLNGAAKVMRRACGDVARLEAQASYIVDKLDGSGRDFVKRLASFIEHDEQTPQVVKRVEVVREGATFMEIPECMCGAPTQHGSGRVFLCTKAELHGGNHGNDEHSLEWEVSP